MLTVIYALLAAAAAQQSPMIVRTPPPVFNPVPIVDTYGDWTFRPSKDYAFSTTKNTSGSAFGVVCGKSCSVFVNFMRTCTSKNDYPVMVNSSAGAFHLYLRCHILEGRHLLSADISDQLLDAIESGGEIGFAVPLDGGQFSVSRFSLNGAMPAMRRAVEYAKAARDGGRTLGDFTL